MKIRTKDIPKPINELLEDAVTEWEEAPAPEVRNKLKRLKVFPLYISRIER